MNTVIEKITGTRNIRGVEYTTKDVVKRDAKGWMLQRNVVCGVPAYTMRFSSRKEAEWCFAA
jgi:hypothetical protein